jgi:hypothetical protein
MSKEDRFSDKLPGSEYVPATWTEAQQLEALANARRKMRPSKPKKNWPGRARTFTEAEKKYKEERKETSFIVASLFQRGRNWLLGKEEWKEERDPERTAYYCGLDYESYVETNRNRSREVHLRPFLQTLSRPLAAKSQPASKQPRYRAETEAPEGLIPLGKTKKQPFQSSGPK